VFWQIWRVVLVGLNFLATDVFLGGKFSGYGIETVQFLLAGQNEIAGSPFCKLFPTEVGCSYPSVDAGWQEAMCVLRHNMTNSQIYLLIWCSLATAMVVRCWALLKFAYRHAAFSGVPRIVFLEVRQAEECDNGMAEAVRVLASGIDFMKLHIGRNVSGQFVYLSITGKISSDNYS
jgi:hypothetical protein